jgi:hypothetical protein
MIAYTRAVCPQIRGIEEAAGLPFTKTVVVAQAEGDQQRQKRVEKGADE